jgi:AraC-like DNA-binding protein
MEVAPAHFRAIATAFKDMRFGLMDTAERRAWADSPLSFLASLRVYSAGIFTEAHNHYCKRGKHPEGVLIYCTAGKGFYQQGSKEWAVATGDLLYCPPNTPHIYGADKLEPWTIYWTHLSGRDLPHFERLARLTGKSPVRHIGIQPEIIAAFTRLAARYRPPYDDAVRLAIQTDTLGILSSIIGTPQSMEKIPIQTQMIQKAMARMEDMLEHPFDLALYATTAGYHPNYFTRLFRQVTGMPPVAYFNLRKMQRACELLSMPGQQVQAVASRLSYADHGFFTKTFSKIIGISPVAYQRKRREEMQ